MYFKNSKVDQLLHRNPLVIFDMNGLIIDDEPLQMEAVNRVLAPFDLSFTEHTWPVGLRDIEFFERIQLENNLSPSAFNVPKLVREKTRIYHTLVRGKLTSIVRPGVAELMAYLRKSEKHTLGLVTSTSHIEVDMILGTGGLNWYDDFQIVLTGDQVVKAKPDPEAYIKATMYSGFSPDQSLVFEDSAVGARAALNAEMSCIVVPHAYTENEKFGTVQFVLDSLTPDANVLKSYA